MFRAYAFLLISIALEVLATAAMQASQQFTRPLASVLVVLGYAGSIWFFMRALAFLPLGLTYAIWAGAGIVLTVIVGWLVFGQRVDLWAAVGVALIVAGIAVIHLLSRMQIE